MVIMLLFYFKYFDTTSGGVIQLVSPYYTEDIFVLHSSSAMETNIIKFTNSMF